MLGPVGAVQMTFRLNGWQRIGIVLSVVWALGAAAYVWQYKADANARTEKFYATCLQQRDDCDAKREALLSAQGRVTREKLFWALAPVPLGWLIVYGVVWLVRWIRAGFKRE
jgi:uncharacterized membrane protein